MIDSTDVKHKISDLGNLVIDDETHEEWRQAYYNRIAKERPEYWDEVRKAIANRDLGPLNILGTKQVAEHFGVSQGTAYTWLVKKKYIPHFRLGNRVFTHDYNLDALETKARELEKEGFNKRDWPRMVYKAEHQEKW